MTQNHINASAMSFKLRRTAMLVFAALLLWLACPAERATAQDAIVDREYALKAAYLYHFGHYGQWPAEAAASEETPFVIGVLGYDPFGSALDTLASRKTIRGKRIVVRRFASIDEYTPCHILFISRRASPTRIGESASNRLRQATEMTAMTPVMLIGETPGFAQNGGMVRFIVDRQSNRLRMEINVKAAEQVGLKFGAQLLNLNVVTIVGDLERGREN